MKPDKKNCPTTSEKKGSNKLMELAQKQKQRKSDRIGAALRLRDWNLHRSFPKEDQVLLVETFLLAIEGVVADDYKSHPRHLLQCLRMITDIHLLCLAVPRMQKVPHYLVPIIENRIGWFNSGKESLLKSNYNSGDQRRRGKE